METRRHGRLNGLQYYARPDARPPVERHGVETMVETSSYLHVARVRVPANLSSTGSANGYFFNNTTTINLQTTESGPSESVQGAAVSNSSRDGRVIENFASCQDHAFTC